MRDREKLQIRDRLLKHRQSLVQRVRQVDDALGEMGDRAWDEMASASESSEVYQALDQQERLEIEAVQAALARLDSGSYGDCQECSEAIVPARLEAIPWAALCVECQERSESA